MIKAIFFDLDGTLLPMNMDVFIKSYFGRLARYLVPHGFEPDALVDAIWRGTAAMVKNDGSITNEERFWRTFAGIFGEEARAKEPVFERFYHDEFPKVKESCGFDPEARAAVDELSGMGYRLVLATNPIFPSVATEERIRWAGLDESAFELFTTYSNSSFTKPNLNYYRSILDKLGLSPEECLMVGNDVGEDMVVRELGMQVYLVTRDLINKGGEDISSIPHGTLGELPAYVRGLK